LPKADVEGCPKAGCPNTDGVVPKVENAFAVCCPNAETGGLALDVLLANAFPLGVFENTDPPLPKADVGLAVG
jgi:hypothetical protein